MKLDVALLCEAATVNGGLLQIIGGGLTNLTLDEFPGELNADLAVRMMLHPTEAGSPHSLQLILQDEDGKRLFELQGQVETHPAPPTAHSSELAVPVVFNLQGPLSRPGIYSFELLIDGIHHETVSFRALHGGGNTDGEGGDEDSG